jgi:hypothetical protein
MTQPSGGANNQTCRPMDFVDRISPKKKLRPYKLLLGGLVKYVKVGHSSFSQFRERPASILVPG